MKLTAFYADEEGDEVSTELPAVAFYSESETYVQVSTSNEHGMVGQSVIFHLKSNQHFESYQYVVSLPYSLQGSFKDPSVQEYSALPGLINA